MAERSSGGGGRVAAVTRADVARAAGVSTAVVSYVVNGGPKSVSEATAARVRQAIDRLGYRPNRTARALALGTTKTLGLVVPDSTNPFYAEYALEIQRAALRRGYAVLLTSSGFDADVELRSMLDLCDRQIDGLIITAGTSYGRLNELTRQGVRTSIVLIDSATAYPGFSTVGPAAAAGAAAAVEHLLTVHQHSRVALVIGDNADPATDGREAGWMQAHAASQRRLGPVDRTAFSRDGGYDAGLRLLQGSDRPTAVITSSDLQAIGLLRAAHELDLRVPAELAIVSFDGTEETRYCWPALTTSRQPTEVMAEAAVQAVLDPARQREHQTFSMDLVIRDSCGCRPGASAHS